MKGIDKYPAAKARIERRETSNESCPYTEDEQRVADYIHQSTGGRIEAGSDPIGLLIITHTKLGTALQANLNPRINPPRRCNQPGKPKQREETVH